MASQMKLAERNTVVALETNGFRSSHLDDLRIGLRPDEPFVLGAVPTRALSSLPDDSAKAIALANREATSVVFDFADHAIIVRPGSDLETVTRQYQERVAAVVAGK